jgi:hypothetical protein
MSPGYLKKFAKQEANKIRANKPKIAIMIEKILDIILQKS